MTVAADALTEVAASRDAREARRTSLYTKQPLTIIIIIIITITITIIIIVITVIIFRLT